MGPHDGHRQRLKTEFLARPDSFPDHKLLELLFFYANPRSDTNPLAHELIDRFGSLAGVLDAPPEELCKVKGMGKHGAVLLKTVKELSGRYLTARTRVDDIARNSRDYYQLLRPYFFGARNELLCLLCMDGKHKVLASDGWVRGTSTPWLLPPVSSPRPPSPSTPLLWCWPTTTSPASPFPRRMTSPPPAAWPLFWPNSALSW